MSEWRAIPNYEGLYEVSDNGLVRSLDRITTRSDGRVRPFKGQLLQQATIDSGHKLVTLCKQGVTKSFTVHLLMARAFIGEPYPGREVCHRNGIPAENRLSNIHYGTRSENQLDRWKQTGKRKSL